MQIIDLLFLQINVESEPPPSLCTSANEETVLSPISTNSADLRSPASSQSGNLSTANLQIPTHWRPETSLCLEKKCLTKECRSDIVRTLVTLTIAKVGPKPSRSHCEQVCRKLILQYPFLKDDIGNGYVSMYVLYVLCYV